MNRRLVASVIIVCLMLQATVTEASEPTRQQIIPQSEFKPLIIQDQPDLVVPIVVEAIATQTPQPSIKPTVAAARSFALRALGRQQFRCIFTLFMYESGWRTRAYNRSSGAYGIPQALPGIKMARAGKDWRTNPITQVKWGIRYIRGRYGSACNALRHFYNYGWY
jgi:resuscitation-promoting factor RpfB